MRLLGIPSLFTQDFEHLSRWFSISIWPSHNFWTFDVMMLCKNSRKFRKNDNWNRTKFRLIANSRLNQLWKDTGTLLYRVFTFSAWEGVAVPSHALLLIYMVWLPVKETGRRELTSCTTAKNVQELKKKKLRLENERYSKNLSLS